MNDLPYYENLITSEHRGKQFFVSAIDTLVNPSVDSQALCATFNVIFDIDVAVGQQLDFIGQWIGKTRDLGTLGVLSDADYRTLLYAEIANNHWDGTIPGAYDVWDQEFNGTVQLFIFDNEDMSMLIGFGSSSPLSPVTYQLATGGYFDFKPEGVRLLGYVFQPTPGVPFFGFDAENATISGLDVGYIASIVPPPA